MKKTKLKKIILLLLLINVSVEITIASEYIVEFTGKWPLGGSSNYHYQYLDGRGSSYAEVDLTFKCKAFSMFGEPAFLTIAKWDLANNGYIYLTKWKKRLNYSEIPKSLLPTIKLIKLVPVFHVGEIDNDRWLKACVLLRRDVGVLSEAGNKWSFNTPGSPSWDKTFVWRSFCVYQVIEPESEVYFDGKTAKQIFKQGLDYALNDIHYIQFDLTEIEKWYEDVVEQAKLKKEMAASGSALNFLNDDGPEETEDALSFLNDQDDMETVEQAKKRKERSERERKETAAIAKLYKQFELEKERFKALNVGGEIYSAGKTWRCTSPSYTIRGKIKNRNAGGNFSINGNKFEPNSDGTFSLPINLDQGKNTLRLTRNGKLLKAATVTYNKIECEIYTKSHYNESKHKDKSSNKSGKWYLVLPTHFTEHCSVCGNNLRYGHKPDCKCNCKEY